MSHALVTIPRVQWPLLRDLYKAHRKSSTAYSFLQCLINWVTHNPQLDVHLYSLDGDWQDDGTFLGSDHGVWYANTLAVSKLRLLDALNLLDKRVSYIICGFPERVRLVVEQHFLDQGLRNEDIRLLKTYWYHLDKHLALKYRIDTPKGFILKRLLPCNAQMVDDHWPYHGLETIHYVERLIRYNDSVGVFNKKHELVAWCLLLPHGALGMLQVLEGYRRRGIGSLLVRYMAKLLASYDLEVMAPVVHDNLIFRGMFKKLGFKVVDKTYWAHKPAVFE
uniref:Glycine N-acyltransferase-like protein 1 n=1 Tax=Zeugodacus cucurbitae TaxID=28588 RepID=A0A0A1WEI1_ZEUCU